MNLLEGFCVSKCCPQHQLWSNEDSKCINASKKDQLWRHPEHREANVHYHNHFMETYSKYRRYPTSYCDNVVLIEQDTTYNLLGNGSLHHLDYEEVIFK